MKEVTLNTLRQSERYTFPSPHLHHITVTQGTMNTTNNRRFSKVKETDLQE